MSKEKQIEKMVKTVSACECDCLNCKTCYSWKLCEALYNAGYRKQSEGEWIDMKIFGIEVPVCSVCEAESSYYEHYAFCPNCGAKMKGGGE
jgi:hypothetical protein